MARKSGDEKMNEIVEKNARITRTSLEIESHGMLTFSLTLDYGGGIMQGAGGYNLDGCSTLIFRAILNTVGVERWEDLTGKTIRVKATDAGVIAIGNILEDKWLDFEEFFKIEAKRAEGRK